MQEPYAGATSEERSTDGRVIRRIDHVGVIVGDVDRAAPYFEDRFGLVRSVDWTEPAGRFRLVYLESGDTTLQLVQPLADGPLATHLAERGEGLHHVCFAVADIDQALESLAMEPDGPPYRGGRGTRVCFLSTRQHGLIVELTEIDLPGNEA